MQRFEETGLAPQIIKAVKLLGFEYLTPIQEKTIPFLSESKSDLIALAQTGTGKTAAFGLPIIEQVDVSIKNTQCLILCPTRELCMQITKDLTSFAKFKQGLNVVAVYGGASIEKQTRDIHKGAQIVVGTPGRVIDLLKRKTLKFLTIQWLVLDEADEMLNMGFKDDLDIILAKTNPEKQSMLFSATMPNEISNIASKYMKDAYEITVGKKNQGAENVRHFYYLISPKDRYLALKRIADINPNIYGIVFCRTRMETKEVADKLMNDGYNADALHGDLSQAQRDHVMSRFRQKHLNLLVATDVAARGLDVNDLSHIINYSLPDDNEIYTHRTGRTGRAGKSGIAMSIVTRREAQKIKYLEKKIGKKFEKKQIPNGKEICEKQLFNLIDKVEKVEVDSTQIEPYLDVIYKKLNWLGREELIQRFVSVEFNRFLAYYKNAQDLNKTEKKNKDKPKKKGETIFSRFHINIGSKDKLTVRGIIRMVNSNRDIKNIEIGKIEILKTFSFFETDSRYEKAVLKAFKKMKFEETPVKVELSNSKISPTDRRKRKRGKRIP